MSKYLYGASVQGIQDFIFKTNKLQEIVGASEIVKNISTLFQEKYKADEIILNAAGNIKAIFNSKEECERVVLEFSKMIQQYAYGITISQAVIKIGDAVAQDDINKLEKNLRIQRNKPSIALDMSLNIMKLNPSTAKPAISNDKDIATSQKIEAYQKIENKTNSDLHKLSNSKNKIAVIHIDGNGLGKLIPNLKKECNLTLSEFSKKLDEATKKAFEDAKGDKKIRDIILGGDDVTVICDADDVLAFTKEFLENFEQETKKSFKRLTACAGIAYSNEKYPFHYAVSLAETLCGVAKTQSNRESSCLMFHNIQSSNFQSWEKFIGHELTIKNDKRTIRCDFGPYYLNETEKSLIKDFIVLLESMRIKESPSSKLRTWLSELYKSDTNAKNILDRIDKMADENKNYSKERLNKNFKALDSRLELNNLIIDNKTPIYDILQVLSITTAFKGEHNDS